MIRNQILKSSVIGDVCKMGEKENNKAYDFTPNYTYYSILVNILWLLFSLSSCLLTILCNACCIAL